MIKTEMMANTFGKISTSLDISYVYFTKKGIKTTNQLITSEQFNYLIKGEIFELSPDELFLPYDWLQDKYTLLEKNIYESPHIELMNSIESKLEIDKCDYVRRLREGTLDLRCPMKVSGNSIKQFKQHYNKKRTEIETGNYNPVKVFEYFGKYIIADGKHTAAMCAVLGVKVKCFEITNCSFDSFFLWLYRKALKKKDYYKKHINFFKKIL